MRPGLQSGKYQALQSDDKKPTPEIRQNLHCLLLTQSLQYREQSDAAAHGSSLPVKVITKGCRLPLQTGPDCFAFTLTLGPVLPQWSFLTNTYVCVEK